MQSKSKKNLITSIMTLFYTFSLSLSLRHFAVPVRASLVAQMIKNMPAIQETWVWSLGQEDPLENFIDRGAWQAVTHGVAKSWTWLSCTHKWCGTAHTVPLQETLFISYFPWMLSCPSTETCHEWCPLEWHHVDCGWGAWEDSEYTCFTTQNRVPSVMLAMYM